MDNFFFFDEPVRNDLTTYNNNQKIITVQGDGYTTGCLLEHYYFNNYYKMTAINLKKQKALDVDPKAIQQISFTGNPNRGKNINDNTTMFFIIKEAKETILDFSQGTVKVL